MRHQRRFTSRPTTVAVLDSNGCFLAPCSPARARQLIKRGRAWFLSADPARIQLTDQLQPEASKQP